jgi:hypothetical protein
MIIPVIRVRRTSFQPRFRGVFHGGDVRDANHSFSITTWPTGASRAGAVLIPNTGARDVRAPPPKSAVLHWRGLYPVR